MIRDTYRSLSVVVQAQTVGVMATAKSCRCDFTSKPDLNKCLDFLSLIRSSVRYIEFIYSGL